MSKIYNVDLENDELGAARAEKNSHEMKEHKYFEENTNDFIYWSGFIVMNTMLMRHENFTKRCSEIIKSFYDRLKFFDLDTLNLVSNNIKNIAFEYCTIQSIYYLDNLNISLEYNDYLSKVYTDSDLIYAKKNPAIIHYAGKPGKP